MSILPTVMCTVTPPYVYPLYKFSLSAQAISFSQANITESLPVVNVIIFVGNIEFF